MRRNLLYCLHSSRIGALSKVARLCAWKVKTMVSRPTESFLNFLQNCRGNCRTFAQKIQQAVITTAVFSLFFTSGFRHIYSEPSLGPPQCDLGASFHVLPVPSSSSDRASGALSVLCSCELTCATGGTFRLRIYRV